MTGKKLGLSVLALGFAGLLVSPTWAQMKGADRSSSAPDSSQKERATSPSDSGKSMKGEQSAAAASWDKEDIKKIQEALKDKGNNPGPVDGIFGPQTQKALRAFQSSQGLKTTGRLDEETVKALGVEHDSSSSSGAASSSTESSSPSSNRSSRKGSSEAKEPSSR